MQDATTAPQPDMGQLFRVFGRIGLLSFGGPAAQIALMHRELVETRPWLSEDAFLRGLSFCTLLPGPEAMQLATYAGWRMNGVRGGLLAGLLFVLPGAFVVLALALAYALLGQVPLVRSLFLGIQATVVVVVLQALWKVSQRALKDPSRRVIAVLAFAGIFLFNLPFPLLIVLAALYGFVTSRAVAKPAPPVRPSGTMATIALWLAIWALPIVLCAAFGPPVLTQIAIFFSKLAVVTFGGAYAVLAYMTQAVVTDFGWLTTAQMVDGLGLAETTPGPLILVTEFVGFMAAYQAGGIALAILGALVTLWVTFAPCFLWIFAAAPYIEAIAAKPRLSDALNAVTAAVVGVILNLSVWFAAHVLFANVQPVQSGWFDTILPDLASLRIEPVALAGLAAFALVRMQWPLPLVLMLAALASAALHATGLGG